MRRASLAIALLVFCMLFVGMCIAASDLDNYLGGQLETLFGRVNDEDVRVNAPILGFVGEWIAIFIIYKWIPDWRHNLETYLPRSNMSPLGYLTHAFRGFVYSITYMALLFSAGSLVYEFDNAYDILASTTATVAYFFALLYDIRGLLWHGAAEFHAAGRIDVRKFDWMLPDSIHQEMLNSPALKLELAKDLRARAAQQRIFSFYSMLGILLLVFVAVAVIIFAGYIANLDITGTNINQIRSTVDSETVKLERFRESALDLDNKIISRRSELHDKDELPAEEEEIEKLDLGFERKDSIFKTLRSKQKRISGRIASQEKTVEKLEDSFRDALKRSISGVTPAATGQEGLNLLIASGITRFGILFVMMFILQVLINLYRYTMRLSAHYLAQADALLLASNSDETLLKILPALMPTQVDFGRRPTTSVEELSRILDTIKRAKDL